VKRARGQSKVTAETKKQEKRKDVVKNSKKEACEGAMCRVDSIMSMGVCPQMYDRY